MVTLDTLASRPNNGRPDHVCSVCWAIQTLDATAAAYLESALDNPAVKSSEIAAALTTEGHDTGAHTISRHRRGLCSGKRAA